MCGICGVFTPDEAAGQPAFARAVERMTTLMARRGPDDESFWSDPGGHLQLGFRRLSIIDLSTGGRQPMVSGDGRSVLVFNGEIYNYRELRHELEAQGVHFRSTSDSEVLLEALSLWGTDAIERLNGMFAFAWYRIPDRTLLLARDHAGIKPLYYSIHPDRRGVAFGSQYNVLLHTPWGEPGVLRNDVLRLYLRLHHIPAPYGLLKNTYQLEPGHWLRVDSDGSVTKRAWWTMPRDPQPELRGETAREALSEALERAVGRQLVADVPVGVFLSGGVDSPLLTATARRQTGDELKAFTIANHGWNQDESAAATRFAQCFGGNHRIRDIGGDDALATVVDVMAAQHEPLADFSTLPTLLVSQLARREVTVALSGDGGDELFFGYERPISLLRNGADFRWPWPVRVALYAAGKYGLGPERSSVVVSKTPGDYYFEVNSRFARSDLAKVAPGLDRLPEDFTLYRFSPFEGRRQLANDARWIEFHGQLQRILKKVDMASMFHSLEVRVPLLDREVLDLSLRIDPFDGPSGSLRRKGLLRDLLGRHVPANEVSPVKLGFSVPLGNWLSGLFEPLVEESLFQGDLYPDGLFEPRALRGLWDDHRSRRADHKWALWSMMTLQWWAREHLAPAARRRHEPAASAVRESVMRPGTAAQSPSRDREDL